MDIYYLLIIMLSYLHTFISTKPKITNFLCYYLLTILFIVLLYINKKILILFPVVLW